ncbi:MAG: hypothetical protein CMJ85_09950 [Planctomycetes bacterium]|jgi:hemimethylated DNA binding protein|nr:hypothetical protein [Planctomycetota bacterium]
MRARDGVGALSLTLVAPQVDSCRRCAVDDGWYRNNRTQPDRDQPWYRVLVHDSDAVTYAAQTSLLPDESEEKLRYVLVAHFFECADGSRHVRNTTPWPPQC